MNAFGKVLRLYAASLLLSALASAASPGVELVLLVDASLSAKDNARAGRDFLGDLLDNLPSRVNLRSYQFGRGPELIPCDPTPECLRELPPGEEGRLTLQQALSKAEALLCRAGAEPEFPGRALVVMSGSGGEKLNMASQCRLELVALGMDAKGDSALGELAGRKGGVYFLLPRARGYTVALHIRKEVWEPAVKWDQTPRADPGDEPLVWLGSCLAAFLALFCGTVLHIIRRDRRMVAETRPAGSSPSCAADLRICSGASLGTVFPLDAQQPVVLGGTQHAAHSPAQLLIDDPEVAGEHCRIWAEGGSFFVDDLGSGQGTFVNDEPTAGRRALASGARLRIGGTTFEVHYR